MSFGVRKFGFLSAVPVSVIGTRLVLPAMLFSAAVTLVLTGIELSAQYRHEVETIRARFDDIRSSYVDSIGGSLWRYNLDQIRLLVDGIERFPEIQYVELREYSEQRGEVPVAAGGISSPDSLRAAFDIEFAGRRIGVLRVEAGMAPVRAKIADRLLTALFHQAIQTFSVAAFVLFLISRMVTSRLAAIAGSLRRATGSSLALPRPAAFAGDELDDVVAALNGLSQRLAEASDEREQALRRIRDQAQVLAQAHLYFITSETAAKLIHEIRQPLTCLSTYVQSLAADPGLADGLVPRIESELRRLNAIIAASAGRGAARPLSLLRQPMAEIVADVLPLLTQMCLDAGVELETSLDDGCAVLADRISLQQVLINLVRNGCEASQHQPAPCRWVHVTVCADPQTVTLAVCDGGDGFPAAILAAGARPFQSARPGGTGYGLTIAKAILDGMGGRLELQNPAELGALVLCRLPRADGQETRR